MISVMYVDDEPNLLTIGKLFLERSGDFVVTVCTGAIEALELIQKETYDAIVSDYQMPKMDGIVFLKKLKAEGNNTPFILFTGRGREEVVIEAMNYGANFYLQKGGDPKSQYAELSNAIRTAVSHHRAEEDLKKKNEELQSAYEELAATEEELRSNLDELIRREHNLQDSQNFLDSVIEQSPHPMWISDDKGTLIRLNKACCDLLQITPDEVIGKYNLFQDTIVKEQGLDSTISSVFDEGKTITFDLEYDSSHLSSLSLGHHVNVILHVTIFPIRNGEGKITNAVIEHTNITEQKRAEAALKESIELFSEYIHHSPIYTYIKEVSPTESRVIHVSDNFIKMIGIPASEMQGKTMAELFPAEFAKKITADDWDVITKGKVTEIQEELNGIKYLTIKFPIILEKRTLLAGYTIEKTKSLLDN